MQEGTEERKAVFFFFCGFHSRAKKTCETAGIGKTGTGASFVRCKLFGLRPFGELRKRGNFKQEPIGILVPPSPTAKSIAPQEAKYFKSLH